MVSFPNAKINIGLHITGKRADGFHDLETIFYPVLIKDALEIIETAADDTAFSFSGKEINGNANDNLCMKAYQLLKKDFPQIRPLHIHLHKNIPMGAGLGGGSSDAAAMLCMLNEKFGLAVSTEKLILYASILGSDCAFFLVNRPCFARGRGEILEEISLDLTGYKILIVNPAIPVNTAEAFSLLDAAYFSSKGDLREAVQKDIKEWKQLISNDFEKPVFNKYPEIGMIKQQLYEAGAVYSAMSGSGSSVFGIFSDETILNIKFPSHYFSQLL